MTDKRWVIVVFIFHSARIGSNIMAMSVTIFGTAFAMNEALASIHAPGIDVSHALSIGAHCITLIQAITMIHAAVITPKTIAATRNSRVGKMRVYMSSTESLIMPIVVQYTQS
jgi:hypothetical protein